MFLHVISCLICITPLSSTLFNLLAIVGLLLIETILFFIGIEVLLEEGVYEAAYPLHDQLIREEDAGEPETWNDRMVNFYTNKICISFIFVLEIISSLGKISKYISCTTNSCNQRLLR